MTSPNRNVSMGGGRDLAGLGTLSYPNAAGKAFIRSNAVIEAEAFGCRPNICGSETDSETVQLRR